MSVSLVLFTSAYPFGLGEQFIDSELPILAAHFSAVIIQPMTFGGSRRERRVPTNVQVNSPVLPENRYRKLIISIRALFRYSDLRHEFFQRRLYLSPVGLYQYLLAVAIRYYWEKSKDKSFDNEILYFYWGVGAACLVPMFRQRISNKIVVRVHGGDLYEDVSGGYLPLRKEIYRSADVICTVSENGKTYLRQQHPEIAGKIVVARLGTEDHGVGPCDPECRRLVLVSCANLIPLKRIARLAYWIAQQRNTLLAWHHFGDGPEYNNIRDICSRFPPNIEMTLHGRVENTVILDFYASNHVDALVSISASEGVPVSIMEAMSFGIPIIATDVGGTKEILFDGGSYLLPPNPTIDEFHDAVLFVQSVSRVSEVRHLIRSHWHQVAYSGTNYKKFVEEVLLLPAISYLNSPTKAKEA